LPEQRFIEKLKNMIYKRFTVILAFNVLILAILIYLLYWSFNQDYLSFTKYGFIGLILLEIFYIIYFVSKTNREIYTFLENFVINESFPKFKNRYKEKYYTKLENELNRIAESYGSVKLEKESEHQLLLNTVEHLDSAIIAIDENEKVLFSNSAFNKLFTKQISELYDLKNINEELYKTLKTIVPSKPTVIKLTNEKIIKPFSVKTNNFVLNKKWISLFSFNDIGKELAKEEIINWQTLIRILRHEIINSVTPISSLANSMNDAYNNLDYHSIESNEILNTTHKSFGAIEKRSKGLLEFIEKFKVISAIPKPEKSNINIKSLLIQIGDLLKAELQKFNVNISINCNKDLVIKADEKLISQVLINLFKNSIEALKHTKIKNIKITSALINDSPAIVIEDTGIGIPTENLEKIFIPFYTTKKKGSGIGLSFARQVMLLHNGFVNIYSEENKYTKVELLF